MASKEKTITINRRKLPKVQVEEFRSQWEMFTGHDGATPSAIIDLLAFTHITGENPSEKVLAQHEASLDGFTHNLTFYRKQVMKDREITARMKADDEDKFWTSSLYSRTLARLFQGGNK